MDLKTALSKLGIPVGTRTVDEIVGTFTTTINDLDAREQAVIAERADVKVAIQELVEEQAALEVEAVRAATIRQNLERLFMGGE